MKSISFEAFRYAIFSIIMPHTFLHFSLLSTPISNTRNLIQITGTIVILFVSTLKRYVGDETIKGTSLWLVNQI
jgi:hypothetical protein